MDAEQFSKELEAIQLDAKLFTQETDREKIEEKGQEFACKLLPLIEDPATLSPEQRAALFDRLPSILLENIASKRSLMEVILFDISHYLVRFINYENTQDNCIKMIGEMAATCNPREVLMVLGEALSSTNAIAAARPLLDALAVVLSRFPAESRAKFIATSLPAVASLTQRTLSKNDTDDGDDENNDEEDEDEDEGEEEGRSRKGKKKEIEEEGDSDEDSDEGEDKKPIQTSVQVRNAFGDSEEDLSHKYSVTKERLNVLSTVLDFVISLIPKGQRFQTFVMNEVGQQQHLLVKMLLHLLGHPLVQAPFGRFDTTEHAEATKQRPNDYLSMALKIADAFNQMGVPAVFVLEHKKPTDVSVFGTKRAERKLQKKQRKRAEARKEKRANQPHAASEEEEEEEYLDEYDSSDESEGSMTIPRRKATEDFYWSELGLGCYCYLLFVVGDWRLPSVYSPLYTFFLSLPCISSLLRNPAPKASMKGLDMVNRMLQDVNAFRAEPVSEEEITDLGSDVSVVYKLCEDLITFMVNCPNEAERQHAYKRLHDCLSLFGEEPRFKLLGELIRKCPYPAITGLLITRLKDEVQRAWISQRGKSPFASHKLLDLFPFFLSFQGDILEKTDWLMNSLNFYRYLLIRDKGQHVIGVWQSSALEIVQSEFLDPLKKELGEKLDEYIQTLSSEQQQKKIELMMKHGFPRLTPQQMDQVSNATLTSLYMVKEIFDRIQELLLEEKEKEKEEKEKGYKGKEKEEK